MATYSFWRRHRRWLTALIVGIVWLGADASVAGAVVGVFPRLDCVTYNPVTNTAIAEFGYTNFNPTAQFIEQGEDNFLFESPQFRNQPETFQPGFHYRVFATNFNPNIGLKWSLLQSVAVAVVAEDLACPPPPPQATCNATPRSDCRTPGTTALSIRNSADDSSDRLKWMWAQGQETLPEAFGRPDTTTEYAFCVYHGQTPTLAGAAEVPAGESCGGTPCWDRPKVTVFNYDNRESPDGVTSIRLRAGLAGEARVDLRGQGANLPDMLPLTLPVTAQLVNSVGECWSSTYPIAEHNSADQFLASPP